VGYFFFLPFQVEKTICESVKRSKHSPFEQGIVLIAGLESVGCYFMAVALSVKRFCSILTKS
jgi:hypothetical protein